MNFLANLFNNDKMKDMALGMLKKTMIENKIKYVVIDLGENETLDVKMFPAEMKPCIMGVDQVTKIDQVFADQEEKIRAYQVAVTELAGQVDRLTIENEALYDASDAAVNELITPENSTDGNIDAAS